MEYPFLLSYTAQFYILQMGHTIHSNIDVFAVLWIMISQKGGCDHYGLTITYSGAHGPSLSKTTETRHPDAYCFAVNQVFDKHKQSGLIPNPITSPVTSWSLLSGCSRRTIILTKPIIAHFSLSLSASFQLGLILSSECLFANEQMSITFAER